MCTQLHQEFGVILVEKLSPHVRINPQIYLSDSPHTPRMHQHLVQEGPKVSQVSQYSQTVSPIS